MVEFITLQTNSNDRRRVSISYADRLPKLCYLLGALSHGTEFKREDLVTFAEEVIKVLKETPKGDLT